MFFQKLMSSGTLLSFKIDWFHGIHGTHNNGAPVLLLREDEIDFCPVVVCNKRFTALSGGDEGPVQTFK